MIRVVWNNAANDATYLTLRHEVGGTLYEQHYPLNERLTGEQCRDLTEALDHADRIIEANVGMTGVEVAAGLREMSGALDVARELIGRAGRPDGDESTRALVNLVGAIEELRGR
jgi:hypothetical protein